jgi:hypothetical protein
MISYEESEKFFVDDWNLGLDIGVLRLRPLYIAGLKSNGVVALPESQWLEGDASDEQRFAILGFPNQEKDPPNGETVTGYIRPCLAGVTPCELPAGWVRPENPIFVGRLSSQEPDSMLGFSGGPIFRLRQEQTGLRYWLHALQSRWLRTERIALGCPMSVVARVIRDKFGSNSLR